jgi:hypothetical protein
MSTMRFIHSSIIVVVVMIATLCLWLVPVHAAPITFTDDFNDGVVDPRYTSIAGASIVEVGGNMVVGMAGTNDGVSMFIEDVVPKAVCYMTDYTADGFNAGDALNVDFRYTDPLLGEFTAFSFRIIETNSVKVEAEAFDQHSVSVGKKTFIIEDCNHEGAFSLRVDLVNGNWVVDWGTEGISDCVFKKIFTDEFNLDILTGRKATGVNITSSTTTDPTVAFNNFSVSDTHVPEPSTYLLFGTGLLGIIGYGWRRRQQHH